MRTILAVADEVDETLTAERVRDLHPDLVVSCGDLPFDYLEYLVTVAAVPLLYVPGNHDPDLSRREPAPLAVFPGPQPLVLRPPARSRWLEEDPGPRGCTNVDGRVVEVARVLVGGLGGCVRYREGPHQYTQREMRRRALALELRARLRYPRRRLDLLLTHAPPLGTGDLEDDPAHLGFAAFHRLVRRLRPRYLLYGHVHRYGRELEDRRLGETVVANVVPHRVLEL
ncbi:MAG TPA: metallophosphoesterase [Actinomycetota bacterium]|nr:metallophosphoesterase [Actinomycetota bacterium]